MWSCAAVVCERKGACDGSVGLLGVGSRQRRRKIQKFRFAGKSNNRGKLRRIETYGQYQDTSIHMTNTVPLVQYNLVIEWSEMGTVEPPLIKIWKTKRFGFFYRVIFLRNCKSNVRTSIKLMFVFFLKKIAVGERIYSMGRFEFLNFGILFLIQQV